jgi:hypothetical protein
VSLNQFGAVMTFAIELETKLIDFYKLASEKNISLSEEFKKRAIACRKRKKKLERSRRENVTEIILEPIEGLNRSNYIIELSSTSTENIKKVETTVTRFYKDATEKINVLECQRVLKRCYSEHQKLINLSNT